MRRMDLETAALAANEAFYDAFNQKDPSLMDAVWADSPEVTCIHPGWNLLYTTEVPVEVLGAKYRWARNAGLL